MPTMRIPHHCIFLLVLLVSVLATFQMCMVAHYFYFSNNLQEVSDDLFSGIIEPSTKFVPPSVLKKWSDFEYLIVFGIPSEDSETRRRRRELQRKHCWSYDGAASLANEWSGEIIAVYVTGRNPENHFRYSAALESEAHRWQDILTLPLDEGRKTTNKKIGGYGFWGSEAEIGMSRKTFLWFYLSIRLFPKATYVGKSDDDTFIRVPAFVGALQTLPRRGIYWGYMRLSKPAQFGAVTRNNSNFLYAYGSGMAMAKDIVEKFLSYKPLHHMIFLPYNITRLNTFKSFGMQHEDVMVGVAVHNSAYPNILYVKEPGCRVHDIYAGGTIHSITLDSVIIHHVKEHDYKRLRELFPNNTTFMNLVIQRNEFLIEVKCRFGASI